MTALSWLGRRLRAVVAVGFLALALGASLLAPWIAPTDPDRVHLAERLGPPGTSGHLLGADVLGRDVLYRLLFGGRVSLGIAVAVVAIGALVGTLIGVAAG